MPKLIVVLDVTNTLLVKSPAATKSFNAYNEALIESLKAQLQVIGSQQEVELYLLTHTPLTDIKQMVTYKSESLQYISCHDLAMRLFNEEIPAKATLSFADKGFKQGLGAVFETLILPQYKRVAEKNESLLTELKSGNPVITDHLWSQTKKDLITMQDFADYLTPVPDGTKPHGATYHYLIEQLSQDFEGKLSVLYFSHDPLGLEAARAENIASFPNVTLTTALVGQLGFIESQEYYDGAFDFHTLQKAQNTRQYSHEANAPIDFKQCLEAIKAAIELSAKSHKISRISFDLLTNRHREHTPISIANNQYRVHESTAKIHALLGSLDLEPHELFTRYQTIQLIAKTALNNLDHTPCYDATKALFEAILNNDYLSYNETPQTIISSL